MSYHILRAKYAFRFDYYVILIAMNFKSIEKKYLQTILINV